MASRLHWFRCIFDHEGKQVACELAEPRETDGGLVHFVRARDIKQAWTKAEKRLHAAKARARRAQYERDGKCRCGREKDVPGGKRCSICVEEKRAENARRRDREHGEVVPTPDRHETIVRHRDIDRAVVRLETLREALRRVLAARTMTAAIQALQDEIEKITGGKAA